MIDFSKKGYFNRLLALAGESVPPDWSRARSILAGIGTALRLAIAGQVILGHELLTLKTELGFCGRGGDRRSKPHDAVLKSLNRTWENWCKAELGMSDDKADRLIDTYEAAKLRVKKHGGQPKLLGLLETHPAKLTEEDRKLLAGMVDKLVWGDTQKDLLEELRIAKCHAALAGGDTSGSKTPPIETQATFAFFSPAAGTVAEISKKIGSLRVKQDYDAYLHQLDIASDDPKAITLESLESGHQAAIRDLQQFLADIQSAKAAKLQGKALSA